MEQPQGSMSFGNTGSYVDNPRGNREPAWDKEIDWFELPDDDEIHLYRLVAGAYYYAQHWIQSFKKDKKPGKPFPAICQNFDPVTNTYAENGCECCLFMDQVNKAIQETKTEWKDLPAHISKMSRRMTMATNAIIRDLQTQGAPSNNAEKWSYIRPMRFPQGFAKTIREQQDKFNKRDGKVYQLNHLTEGKDLQISYNSQSDDKNKIYVLNLGQITPLTPAELGQEAFLTNFGQYMKYPKQAEISDALRRFGYYDWITEHKNSAPRTQVPKAAPQQQTIAPAQAAPSAPAASAFAAPAAPEPPFEEPEPAAAAPAASPTPSAAQQAPTIAPTTTVAMQQQTPVAPPQPAPVAQPVPVAAPVQAAPAAAPLQNGVEGRLQDFSTRTGVKLAVAGTVYQKALRLYTPTLAVPTCWSTYSATSRTNREQCKQCPLRLDCMMATG